jgi:hypothetical protein
MDASPHPIDKLISEACARLVKAERDAEKARIEITALKRAKAALGEMATVPLRHRASGRQRKRALSDQWQAILRQIARHGEAGADLDAILRYCHGAGVKIERHSLRGQMWNYVNRGFLTRPRDGVFCLTPEGDQAASMTLQAGEEDASPRSGEAS